MDRKQEASGTNKGVEPITGVRFDNPPVRLVMLHLWFQPIHDLQTLDLATLRTHWLDTFPQIQEMAPLPSWDSRSRDITFIDESDDWPMAACIFMNFEGDREVLIQQDRLILTWRFGSEQSIYPGFSVLLKQVTSYFHDFIEAVKAAGIEQPKVARVGLQYTNEIEGVDHQDAAEALLLGRPIERSSSIRKLNSVFVGKHFCGTEKNRNVTLQVSISEDQQKADDTNHEHEGRRTTLRIEGNSDVTGDEDHFGRLIAVHNSTIEQFSSLIGPGLRKLWGDQDAE